MMTSCAPMPFIRSNSPSPWRSSVPSTCSAGNLLGTTRRSQPARSARRRAAERQHLGRRHVLVARAERAVRRRRGRVDRSMRKSFGRLRRSVEMMTQRPVTGSLRSSGKVFGRRSGVQRRSRFALRASDEAPRHLTRSLRTRSETLRSRGLVGGQLDRDDVEPARDNRVRDDGRDSRGPRRPDGGA